jgi:hypothetical protein
MRARHGFRWRFNVPRALVSQINLSIIGKLAFEMVGGVRMSAEIGLADIDWLGQLRKVEVIVSEANDALIGTELLIGSTLVIDYSLSRVTISTNENGG